MANRSGAPVKRSTSYRVPTDLEKKIDNLLKTKEYSSQSDIITTALRFWFDNKDSKTQKESFKEWVVSEEGENYLKGIIRKVDQE